MWCAELLDVPRAPNNGTEGSLHHLLTSPPTLPPRSNGSDYSTGQYPATDRVYETIVNATDTGCNCSKVTPLYDTIRIRDLIRQCYGSLRFTHQCRHETKPLRESSDYTMRRSFLFKITRSHGGIWTPSNTRSLSPPEPITQTASRSVQQFLQGPRMCQTDRPTDITKYSVCNNRPHLRA